MTECVYVTVTGIPDGWLWQLLPTSDALSAVSYTAPISATVGNLRPIGRFVPGQCIYLSTWPSRKHRGTVANYRLPFCPGYRHIEVGFMEFKACYYRMPIEQRDGDAWWNASAI